MAVIYGLLSLVMLPFMVIAVCAGAQSIMPMFIMLILYPIMGFIGGIIMAFLYNISSNFVGGLEVEVESPGAAGPVETQPQHYPVTEIPKAERQNWRS